MVEIYHQTGWYEAPEALRPALKNQAQRFPARGVGVRRLDHFNCLAVDVAADRRFLEDSLGFRLTEQIVLDSGEESGMWLTATNRSCDVADTREAHGILAELPSVEPAMAGPAPADAAVADEVAGGSGVPCRLIRDPLDPFGTRISAPLMRRAGFRYDAPA